nr:calmodulin binding protein PICBP-like [Ipomoea batatas]GMD85659.1 calmodulin binding protein PICBP-like [Ipomoea batatas]
MTDTSQGKIKGKEVIPADSSASRSLNQEGEINNLKNFRNTRSFRRKGRSKIMKPTKPLSDEAATPSESSTPDIKNQGKKGISQASNNSVHSQENLGSSDGKSLQTLMRATSLRTLRASFKSKKRPSFRCSQVPKVKTVGKPTCSSTIKNSKFTENAGLKIRQTESDRLDMYKVCSYHHCSLHGHSHDPSNPPKRFYMRRKSLKSKKSIKRKNESNSNSNTALSVTEHSNVDSDSKNLHPPDGEAKVSAEKEKNTRMWHLIRRHLHSGLADESKNKSNHEVHDENLTDDSRKLLAPESSGLSSTADQDVKILAVKLVREAIEKILLPEVPDQSPDDLSNTSDTAPDQEPSEENLGETSTGSNIEKTKREVANEAERKAPKHWSNLKKWILLQRFIKEMEKVRKISPRKPRNLQSEPDPEPENVHLRQQIVEERKRGEEWMLDYALQQAISQLAPTQKRKVEMLVKAFETVVPPQGDLHFQFSFPKLKSNAEDDETISKANDDILSCCNPIDNDTQSSKSDVIKVEADAQKEVHEYAHNIIAKTARESEQQTDEFQGGYPKDGTGRAELETQNYISMWHMVSQHVLSGIASKIGSELLDGADDETKPRGSRDQDLSKPHDEGDSGNDDHGYRRNFNRDDAIKLVREAVNEILITQSQDDPVDTKSDQLNRTESSQHNNNLNLGEEGKETIAADNVIANDESREVSEAKGKGEVPKPSKKWSKLKNLLLLKRSIMAMENARKLKLRKPQHLPLMPNTEPERVDLRHEMMDERKKAEQWMLDYAVQHIVTKLTPARKRRVAMLVEAFEAVVPFPEI